MTVRRKLKMAKKKLKFDILSEKEWKWINTDQIHRYLREIQESVQTDKYLWLTFALYNSGVSSTLPSFRGVKFEWNRRKKHGVIWRKKPRFNESNYLVSLSKNWRNGKIEAILYITYNYLFYPGSKTHLWCQRQKLKR